jgi:hypothetical protein
MSRKLNIGIPCSEANHVCDKSQYKESSFWEKVKLNIHLLYCKACREYTKQNINLSSIITKSKVTCMDKKNKDCLKTEFEKALKENNIK